MNSDKDYYRVLGVSPNATPDQIKRVYRRLAREYHPDLNPKRKSAERRFKELQEAYAALSRPDARWQNDQSSDGLDIEVGDEAFGDGPKFSFAVELNWRRKLALSLWLVCTLGTFLPANFLHEAPWSGLAVSTIPLLCVWTGDWLSEDDSLDMSIWLMFKGVFGKILVLAGWVIFARLVGGMVIAPIIMKMG